MTFVKSQSPSRLLPYGHQSIDDDDIDAVVAVLKSDRLTTGPQVDAFETALQLVTGARHAVAVANGTAALQLLYAALGLGAADQIVVPAVTFLATASAAELLGCEAVIADVDPESGLMTPSTLAEALLRAPRARAVVAVHLGGQSCDMPGLGEVCQAHGVELLEDACHIIGGSSFDASGETHPVGAARLSRAACFSFHPVKTITTGEGGAVTTDDSDLAERVKLLRNHGMVRSADLRTPPTDARGRAHPWYYSMQEPAWNYRISDMQCALGVSQLRKLDAFVAERSRLAARYDEALRPLANVVRPVARCGFGIPSWHLYSVLCMGGAEQRADLFHHLFNRGIQPQVHYIPLHHHERYRRRIGDEQSLPGAETYYARTLSLPLFVGLTDAEQDYVVSVISEFS